MADILEGIQYSELKNKLPHWSEDQYKDWTDAGSRIFFHSGTRFRMKPDHEYVLTDSTGKLILKTKNKDEAISLMAEMLDYGNTYSISREDNTTLDVAATLAQNNIQFKTEEANKWTSGVYFAASGYSSRVFFRVRPDAYWSVSVSTGISKSELIFDDVDDLDKYVSRQLRTSDNNIVIERRAYALR